MLPPEPESLAPPLLQERNLLNAPSKVAAGRSQPPTSEKSTSGHTPGSDRTTAPSRAADVPSPAPQTTKTTWGYTQVCPLQPESLTLFSSHRFVAAHQNWSETPCLSPGEKPYVCTVPGCQKRFTEYSSLYKHHVVHTPCKPYNCNHCGKTYKQISTLAMHKRTAHNDTEPIEEEQEAYFEPPAGQCTCHVYVLKCDAMINNVNGLQRGIRKCD